MEKINGLTFSIGSRRLIKLTIVNHQTVQLSDVFRGPRKRKLRETITNHDVGFMHRGPRTVKESLSPFSLHAISGGRNTKVGLTKSKT